MTSVDQLNDQRRRILDGEEVSRDELRASIKALVGERLEAHKTTTKSKAKSTPVPLDDLL
jgi:hypothetical protein